MCKKHFFNVCILFLLCLQAWFSLALKNDRAVFENTPFPPTKLAIKSLSFGDEQLLFRYYVLQLQNAGDKIGFVNSIRNHNYARLYQWFIALDDFDKNSRLTPSIAANYYGAAPNPQDVHFIVEYLITNGEKNIDLNWRSLTYAAYLAMTIRDYDLVVKSTKNLVTNNSATIPLWAKAIGLFYMQNDIDKKFDSLTSQQKVSVVCNSWKFLKIIEQDINAKKIDENQVYANPIFSSIILSRINKVKQNTKYLKECNDTDIS